MRIVFCGVAAIALSGCSWMGFGAGSQAGYGDGYSRAGSSKPCCDGTTLSRWNMEEGFGTDFMVGGDAITGSQAAPALGPVTTLSDVSMKDAYDMGYRASLGGSYALNPNRKVTLRGTYAQAEGNEVVWGTQGGTPLLGTMSDYKSLGLEAGLRQYFKPAKSMPLRTYVEGQLGASRVNAITLDNIRQAVPSSLSTPTSLGMYKTSWVPTAAALIGVETPMFKRMTVGVETGIRYAGDLKADNSAVSGGFNSRYAGFNNGGSRLTVPVTIRGRYRF